jgi:alpha-tubulin suppressor-like RCC1 family protein
MATSSNEEADNVSFGSLPTELKERAMLSMDLYTLGAVASTCHELYAVAERVLPKTARDSSARHGIAAGGLHSAVIGGDGGLFTFGTDDMQRGYLGLGATFHTTSVCMPPTRVPMAGVRCIAVATSSFHTLALTASGQVFSFGCGDRGQLGHGNDETLWQPRPIEALARVCVVAISAGQQHSLVLSDGGTPHAFGSNFCGKLGMGDQRNRSLPTPIGGALASARVGVLAAGALHSLAATQDTGRVFSFGSNASCQLGHGMRNDEHAPRLVAALEAHRVVRLAAGEHHSLAIDEHGVCYSWGAGEARERTSAWAGGWLGHRTVDEQPLPRSLQALSGVRAVAVAAGSRHSLVLTAGGDVYSFGDGSGGKLGHSDGAAMHWVPKRIQALEHARVVAVAAGESHSMCMLRDGQVLTWGSGLALGLGAAVLTEQAVEQPASWGSAGNYEWAPCVEGLRWQVHVPSPVHQFASEP